MSPAVASKSILGRFPRHLEADQPGKLLGAVVDALASELEVATNEIGRVRRSRRLAEAAESVDLLRLAGLHGIEGYGIELLRQRLTAVARIRQIAEDASLDDTKAQEAFSSLPSALGLAATEFKRWPGETSDGPVRSRLGAAIAPLVANASMLRLLRAGIETVIALHRRGNGTVGALLGGAANALQLNIQDIHHSTDRYWHVARCRDRLRITRPGGPVAGEPKTVILAPADDNVVLEENPIKDFVFKPQELRHGGHLTVFQRGYEAAPVTIRVVAIDLRTVAPMVVNLDTGVGLAFTGSLDATQELVYTNEGGTRTSAAVAGTDVGAQCYWFQGGVFADAQAPFVSDFVFADAFGKAPGRDNVATFAQTDPPGTFDPKNPLPTAFEQDHPLPARTGDLPAVFMPPGAARWALFVGAATFDGDGDAGQAILANPRLLAGRFDWSVFDPEAGPPDVGPPDHLPVGKIGFEWREHQPFMVNVWLPKRFMALDAAPEPLTVPDRVSKLLERHRAAGVEIDVSYADDAFARRLANAFP